MLPLNWFMSVTPIPKKAVAVIFAGGQGKRLWPVSTSKIPKQINTIFSKKTLLGETFERVSRLFPRERIVIVTTKQLEKKIKKIVSLPEKNWIVQPKNADTTAAMSLTALHLQTLFPESIAILFYSDHKISNLVNFRKAIRDVENIAKQYPFIVTIGTLPTEANTQFGYIKLGKKLANNLYEVDKFTEKPDISAAQKYLKSKQYVWNTGVYVWQTSVLLEAVKGVAPSNYEQLLKLKILIGNKGYEEAVSTWFKNLMPESFDKSISERLSKMLVYVAKYDWEDVGNWKTVYKLAKKDRDKNAVINKSASQDVKFINSSGNMVLSKTKNISLIGIENIIVVETKDSLLICQKDQVGEVKKIV